MSNESTPPEGRPVEATPAEQAPSPGSSDRPGPPGGGAAGPPPIVPPFNPWQAPGGAVPPVYPAPVPPGSPPPPGAAAWSPPPGNTWSPPPGNTWSPAPGNTWSPAPGSTWSPPPEGTWPPPPGVAWPPAPRQRTFTGGLIAAIAVFAVVLLGCIGAVGAAAVHAAHRPAETAAGDRPAYPLFPTDEPTVPGLDDDDTTAPRGPHASATAVKEVNDLSGLCDDQTFFPTAPKYQGKAPHPLAIMIKDRTDSDTRINETVYDPGYSSSKARSDAWNVYFHPAKVQLTACVDLVSGGAKVKTCKFDDPKPDSLPLKVGTYQLTLFETATRKQLFSKKITGDDRSCPTVVLIGDDHNLYTGISDHTYVSALKTFVEK